MGTFFHPITLVSPSGRRETLEAMVDTTVLFAVIPAAVLRRLGVKPLEQRRPRRTSRRIAQVEAELAGQRGYAMVVFGTSRDVPRIGRHTLDSFLLDIDAEGKLVQKELRVVWHA